MAVNPNYYYDKYGNRQVSIRCSPDLFQKFRAWCEFQGMNSGLVVNTLMTMFIANRNDLIYQVKEEIELCQKVES